MLFDDYCKAYQDIRDKHGDQSVVLIEVGSFFELYAITDQEVQESRLGYPESFMRGVCDLLEIQMTRKNKSINDINRSNPFMAGFPSFMMDKYMDILVSAGYTVAVVEQKKSMVNANKGNSKSSSSNNKQQIYRTLARIESPGTYMPTSSTHHGNRYTMALYLYCTKSSKQAHSSAVLASFGAAVADFTTGECYVYESYVCEKDHRMIKEDMYRIALAFKPVEIIVLGCNAEDQISSAIGYLDLESACIHKVNNEHIVKTYKKASYQNALLSKVFAAKCKETMLSPLELFDLERKPCASTALCALLQFAHDHGEHVTRRIKPPAFSHDTVSSSCVFLNYNSAVQLDVLPGKHDCKKSFIGMFNKCSTPMGRRLFRSRLLEPTHDIATINDRLDRVDLAGTLDPLRIRKEFLEGMCDVPRLLRRLVMAAIDHAAIWRLHTFVKSSTECLSVFGIPLEPWVHEFSTYIETTFTDPASDEYVNHQVLFKSLKSDIETITDALAQIEELIRGLNTSSERYKLDSTDRDGYFIAVTSKRHKEALCDTPLANELKAVGNVMSAKSTSVRFTHDIIAKANMAISDARNRIQDQTKVLISQACDAIVTHFHDQISDMATQVADIDVACTVAMLATEHAWTRPILVSKNNNNDEDMKPYVDAQGLRHPIVESILSSHGYVPNDVKLGKDGTDGILLFGINASGKSSFMKSVGLAVIMAQAGMFVSAERLTLCPYKAVYTRIAAGDNIFAGRSTFTSEILELRNIIKGADKHALVIGDELCAGTESSSATAIVAAGLERLGNVGCTFLLATHLHELTRMDLIQHIENLAVYHLDVRYDEANETIIYDRKLVPGPGDALYGLEVCKALDMDKDFIRSASMIRNRLLGVHNEILSTKESRYNAQVYLDTCQVCHKTMSVETHHMVPQSVADENGIVLGRYHKNKEYNLLCVCQTCHDRIHAANDACTYVMTTKGPVLNVEI